MTSHALLILPILAPLAAAFFFASGKPNEETRRWLMGAVIAAVGLLSVCIGVKTGREQILVSRVGNWPAPLGIVLWADRLSAIFLLVSTVTFLALLVRKRLEPSARAAFFFAGTAVLYLAGDAFTLTLGLCLCLLAKESVADDLAHSALGIFFLLLATALLYGTFGSTNLQDLANKFPTLAATQRLWHAVLVIWVMGVWSFQLFLSFRQARRRQLQAALLSLCLAFVVLRFSILTLHVFNNSLEMRAVLGSENRLVREPLKP